MRGYLFYDNEGNIAQADRHFVDVELDVRVPNGLSAIEIDNETFEKIEGRLEYFYAKKGRIYRHPKEKIRKFVKRDKLKGIVK